MRLDQGRRGQREPLAQADVLVAVCSKVSLYSLGNVVVSRTGVEDFEELHGCVTNILNVVAVGGRDVANVARLVVVGPCVARRSKQSDTAGTLTVKEV